MAYTLKVAVFFCTLLNLLFSFIIRKTCLSGLYYPFLEKSSSKPIFVNDYTQSGRGYTTLLTNENKASLSSTMLAVCCHWSVMCVSPACRFEWPYYFHFRKGNKCKPIISRHGRRYSGSTDKINIDYNAQISKDVNTPLKTI